MSGYEYIQKHIDEIIDKYKGLTQQKENILPDEANIKSIGQKDTGETKDSLSTIDDIEIDD